MNVFLSISDRHRAGKGPNTSARDAHINTCFRIVNKHRNVADKLGWEPRRKYATARFSIGFRALETGSSPLRLIVGDQRGCYQYCDNKRRYLPDK